MPTPEKMGTMAKVMELMKSSPEYLEKVGKFFQSGQVGKFYVKDNGDGTYTTGQYDCRTFFLRQVQISVKQRFVPSDNSSHESIRPISKRRQLVPFVKSYNCSIDELIKIYLKIEIKELNKLTTNDYI